MTRPSVSTFLGRNKARMGRAYIASRKKPYKVMVENQNGKRPLLIPHQRRTFIKMEKRLDKNECYLHKKGLK